MAKQSLYPVVQCECNWEAVALSYADLAIRPYDPHVPLDNAAAYLSSVHAEATREIVRALKNPASPHAEEQAQWRKPQQGSAEYDDGAVVATELYDEESVAEDEEEGMFHKWKP